MSYNQSLRYLASAVKEELSDIGDVISSGYIERAINEGQRALEPNILREMVATVSWAAGATEAALPDDFHDDVLWDGDDGASAIPTYRIFGGTMYFLDTVTLPWSGRLFYNAHFPDITGTDDCKMPERACDALISYALSRCCSKLVASRADYRKYSTLAGGDAATIDDLAAMSNAYLDDFNAVRDSDQWLPAPSGHYSE